MAKKSAEEQDADWDANAEKIHAANQVAEKAEEKCGLMHPEFEVPCTLKNNGHSVCGTWAKFAANGVQKFITWQTRDARTKEKFYRDKADEILEHVKLGNGTLEQLCEWNGWVWITYTDVDSRKVRTLLVSPDEVTVDYGSN